MGKKDDAKLAELILYVSDRCESDPNFGATKLNKILFYSDAIVFGKTGKSITGQEYQKLEYGPAPRRLLPVRKRLIDNEDLAIKRVDRYGLDQQRTIALRAPKLDLFSGEEIATVESVIQILWNENAVEASDLSHRGVGWILAKEGETIPMESVFLSQRKLTPSEVAHGRTLANR
jgi:hypothetical protein